MSRRPCVGRSQLSKTAWSLAAQKGIAVSKRGRTQKQTREAHHLAQQEHVGRGSGSSSGQGSFVLDNNTYNVITILHQKSKGLEAYDKYLRDAQNDRELASILERIRQHDQQFVQQLQRHLARLLAKTVGASEDIAA